MFFHERVATTVSAVSAKKWWKRTNSTLLAYKLAKVRVSDYMPGGGLFLTGF